MKSTVVGRLVLALASALVLTVSARPGQNADHKAQGRPASARSANNMNKPVKLIGAILVPGNPLRFDISWVDQATARYYLAEGGNAGVDVFDAENDLFLGRIPGFHGVGAADDPCGPIEGMGPSGVLVTPDNHLWADDAHGTVKVFDLANAKPPFADVKPIATISTGAHCRADEIGFDPQDHVIMVGNPEEHPPFATVISSDAPYAVLSKIPFADAGGIEQPLWDPELKGGRMLLTVPDEEGDKGKVVVINLKDPKNPVIEATYPTPHCGSGLALGPSQHLLVGCEGGKPLLILNAVTGKAITTVEQTQGADEVWYNSGDNHFYAPFGFGANPTLSVIDAATGKVLSNLPAGPVSHSVAAYRGNNHIFVPIAIPNERAKVDGCNVMFGFPEKHGCIAVYAHEK
jgi:DNA-binding beta-propeller fold protein YncE